MTPTEPTPVDIEVATSARTKIEAQEAERAWIARELHDVVGQALTAVRLSLLSIRDVVVDPVASDRLDESLVALDHAFVTVRTFAVDLRPPVLDDVGLEAAIRSTLRRGGRDGGFHVSLSSASLPVRLSPEIKIACYRVFQEALTNITRHARATRVAVRLRLTSGCLELLVTDDGLGFDVDAAIRNAKLGRSLGLGSMSERARLLGGSLEIRSARGQGTRIRASFPAVSSVVVVEAD